MKIDFNFKLDGKIHYFKIEWTSENNYQVQIDNEIVMQKLGA